VTRQVIDFSTPEQREKLQELAGVKFSDEDFADLSEVASLIFQFYYPEHDLLPRMRKDARWQWWSATRRTQDAQSLSSLQNCGAELGGVTGMTSRKPAPITGRAGKPNERGVEPGKG
jgi:hypothetical protein